jgi:hypothetical protein
VLTHARNTVAQTVQRHMMEIREHLIEVSERVRLTFGESVDIVVSSGPPETQYLKSAKIAALLDRLPSLQVPRLDVCTHVLGEYLPAWLDARLGSKSGELRAALAAALAYPVNMAIGFDRELRNLTAIDFVTGVLLFIVALGAFAVPLWYHVVLAKGWRDRVTALLITVLLFPLYCIVVIAAADLLQRALTATAGWVLGLMALPAVAAFLFLFSKVLAALRWLYLRHRRHAASG